MRCQLGRLWYGKPNEASNAIDYAKFRSRSHDAPVVTVIGKAFWDIGHALTARPFSESFLKFFWELRSSDSVEHLGTPAQLISRL